MMEPTLGHIWEALSDYVATGDEPVLSSVVVDSREVVPGSLFVALAGERTDGHEFVDSAFERGAIAALVERNVRIKAAIVANAIAAAITENAKNIKFVTPVTKNSRTPGADSARSMARSHASRRSDLES